MSIHCDICAAVEEVPSTFPSHRYRFPMGTRWYCPSCWPHRESSYAKLVLPTLLLLSIPGIVWFTIDPILLPGPTLILLSAIVLFAAILLILHELAHAVVGRACGMEVHKIVIGEGPIVRTVDLFGWRWEIHALPFRGYVLLLATSEHRYRLKEGLMIAAGPLLHIVLLVLIWRLFPEHLWNSRSDFSLIWWFFVINAAYLASSLGSRSIRTVDGVLQSDRVRLRNIPLLTDRRIDERIATAHHLRAVSLYKAGRLDEARAEFERAMAKTPDDPALLLNYSLTLLDGGEPEQAIELYDRILAREHPLSDVYALAANDKAVAAMARNPGTLSPDMALFSEIPYLHDPNDSYFTGTRGAALVSLGRVDEGLALLYESFSHHIHAAGRAWVAAYIALGEGRSKRFEQARHYLAEAETLDPSCGPLPSIRDELSGMEGFDPPERL